jgi:5-formyltetrahydrofolate cyclo-ligase
MAGPSGRPGHGRAHRPASGLSVQETTSEFDWRAWRRAARERLIAERLAIPAERRMEIATQVTGRIDAGVELPPGSVVSFYWPFRGELDLRPWIIALIDRGVRAALPVVTVKQAPMSFRPWAPGEKMERGIWNIPVPATTDEVSPDVVIAPLVGFDRARFRLGYGGGYFDRTLAVLSCRPRVIGVGYAFSELPTIHPRPHDIAMDLIVTDSEVIS